MKNGVESSCPIPGIMSSERVGAEAVLSLLKSEWKLLVLNLVSYNRHMRYNEIKEMSGLNSKTLSMVLRELTQSGLLSKEVTEKWPIRADYSLTSAGMKIATVRCPLIEFAANGNKKRNSPA